MNSTIGGSQKTILTPIPSPPGYPIIGNLLDVSGDTPIYDFRRFWQQYGEIWKLRIAGREPIFVNSVALADELCDESRFSKKVGGALEQIRNGVHSGLFTAYDGEEEWGIAHRVLMPAFGPLAITNMFDEMKDIASQMVLKFARNGPDAEISVTDDFTRLTLDSIALCAMDTRFNSFYHEKLHPFVDSMVGFLLESGHRTRRTRAQLALGEILNTSPQYHFTQDIKFMQKVAMDCVERRRRQPSEKKDLLNAMLNGVDPKTGKKMSDQSICDNMITFLIAGHETTSGTLSFLFYYLLKNPKAYRAAQEEVDGVIGRAPITVDHLAELPYVTACLRETLRLQPTAPGFGITPKGDQPAVIKSGDKSYEIPAGGICIVSLPQVHRDPLVYGDDAEDFRPERMLDENFNKLPRNAWKPFGNGMRACIGRPFAWQEALLATSILLQYFNFDFVSSYDLVIKQTLTIKPTTDFKMHARLRPGVDPVHLEHSMYGGLTPPHTNGKVNGINPDGDAVDAHGRPMTILYGSNTGTCQALAQALASDARSHGFNAEVAELDSAVENVPKKQPVIIITASFEGEPPDNAARFVEWVHRQNEDVFEDVAYAVFGCGHSDWAKTFHKIPTELDNAFATLGGKRLATMGTADAAKNQMTGEFESWEPELWEAIKQKFGEEDAVQAEEFEIEVKTEARSLGLRQNVKQAKVIKSVKISQEDAVEERHIEVELPPGMEYRTGDYLAILPLNPPPTVNRVLKHYSLPRDTVISVKTGRFPGIPTDSTVSLQDLLSGYVELAQPATRKNIKAIAKTIPTSDSTTIATLNDLASDSYESRILTPRISVLDILESYPSATFSLAKFLQSVPAMRIRSYSISSSALATPARASLTVSVLKAPSVWNQATHFLGVASHYIASLEAGDTVQIAVRPSHQAFHPPADAENTPVLMICAGTGIAPFRGFVQERATQLSSGRKLARAILYIGARREVDVLYKDEIQHWHDTGAVEVRYVFSREPEKTHGCKYVQERMWREREELVGMFDQGAKVFVCGSAKLGEGVRETTMRIYSEVAEKRGKPKTKEEVRKWFEGIRNERYAVDVFT